MRLPDHLTGHINPMASGRTGDRLYLHVDDARPDGWERYAPSDGHPSADRKETRSSAWAGLSGAAVFSNDLLIGVVKDDDLAFTGGRLTVTPIRTVAADPDFARLVGVERIDPESVELWRLFEPTRSVRGRQSPASLLRPEREVVSFYGRQTERASLNAWCEDDDADPVRLLVGPGGQGKTRLAMQVCSDRRAAGWVAGPLAGHAPSAVLNRLGGTQAPVLLVVDYAETRQGQLTLLLDTLRRTGTSWVRLLLLARSASEDATWWANLRGSYPDLCGTVIPEPLAPLEPDPLGRAGQYVQALADLAKAWSSYSPSTDWAGLAARMHAPGDLTDDRYGLALTLHTQALTQLLQAGPSPVADIDARTGRTMYDVLLDHEQHYWTDTASSRQLHPRYVGSLLRQAVAAAALCGAADRRQAMATVGRIPEFAAESGPDRRALAEWLRDLYPSSIGYWGSLAPDRIAEHLIGQTLRPSPDGDPDLAAALLTDGKSAQLCQGLIVLARAAYHQQHIPAALGKLLAKQPKIVSAVHNLTVAEVTAIVDTFPNTSVDLAVAAASLTEQAVMRLRPDPDIDTGLSSEYLRLLNNLSVRLAALGRREDALSAINEAVDLYRDLAAARPDAFGPDLAMSLNNQSVRLAALGRREDALSAINEAVDLYRDLAAARPDAFRPDLAMSLNNQSVRLAALGRHEDALSAINEAVDLYRDLAAARPDAFGPDLASSLNNQSNRLAALGRREDALSAINEAVDLGRDLAAARPDAFRPDLASSLNNQSNRLAALGRREDALSAINEAVQIRRDLAAARPDAFRPDLASSLNNQSVQLAALGRHEDALTAINEAVQIRRELQQRYPAVYAQPLAQSLTLTGLVLCGSRTTRPMARALLEALTLAIEHQLNDLLRLAVSLLRDERQGDQPAFDAVWRELTGAELPDWLGPDDAS
ncbi:tetratricopeptide repeat protein [Pseudofrankia inefficax]|uniref:tetratricopeptide repeat protein n=1 Tax=Pseudofrankia inefficax (strain DSM 45817 / CECT 9037 / DDB 130130 / EuI1c) TaxID=298654 RepID=UPI003F634450